MTMWDKLQKLHMSCDFAMAHGFSFMLTKFTSHSTKHTSIVIWIYMMHTTSNNIGFVQRNQSGDLFAQKLSLI